MSNEQHEMYGETVNEEHNSNQVHDDNNTTNANTLPTSPSQGSKRKRDDDNSTVEETGQERRASLKRNNAIPTTNSSFMAVNQSGPPTAPMAFAGVSQGPGSINGTGQDPVGLENQLHSLPQMTVSQQNSINFPPEGAVRVGQLEASYNTIPQQVPQDQQQQQPPPQMIPAQAGSNIGHHGHPPAPAPSTPASKPAVGTEEWHKVRRDNHKEVERRRRETINEGINELAKIVPGCEKNKGSILQRAVQYIQQLKENEATNIEKWTLEKLLTEQAIAELTTSNEKLKQECERAWREAETWKKSCLAATEGGRSAENSTSSS